MEKGKELEFNWVEDKEYYHNLGSCGIKAKNYEQRSFDSSEKSSSGIFLTHLLHTHYQSPPGFDFMLQSGRNIEALAKKLVEVAKKRSELFRTKHILVNSFISM